MRRLVAAIPAHLNAAVAAGSSHGHRQNIVVNIDAIPDATYGEFGAAATLSLCGDS